MKKRLMVAALSAVLMTSSVTHTFSLKKAFYRAGALASGAVACVMTKLSYSSYAKKCFLKIL